MGLRPLGNSILFTFMDDTSNGNFVPKTKSGIIMTNMNTDEAQVAKWGRVLAVGDDCVEVKKGDFVLLTPLKWTVGFTYDKIKIWKTDEDQIMAITDDIANTLQY